MWLVGGVGVLGVGGVGVLGVGGVGGVWGEFLELLLLFLMIFFEMVVDCWDGLVVFLMKNGCIFLSWDIMVCIFGCCLGIGFIYFIVICNMVISFFFMFW